MFSTGLRSRLQQHNSYFLVVEDSFINQEKESKYVSSGIAIPPPTHLLSFSYPVYYAHFIQKDRL
ncbi:hypothetical protein PESHB4_01020 [Pediococcus ethanolidurans]